MLTYEYRHVISFEETNLVGNVYYANHLLWQGRCREMFLRDHAPEVLREMFRGLALVTLKVTCEYFSELSAFDEVVLQMSLETITQNRIKMLFDYFLDTAEGRKTVARGQQEVACMRREGTTLVPVPLPESLRGALQPYMARAA